MSAGKSFLLVENVRSSAYLEYVHPASDASFTNRMSSKCATRLEITGEQARPKLHSRADERIGSTFKYCCVQRFARVSKHHSRIHPDASERCAVRSRTRTGAPVSGHFLRLLAET